MKINDRLKSISFLKIKGDYYEREGIFGTESR